MTRGAVLPVIGSAEAPFQRIARELMGYYLVAFEPQAGDRDGKQHAIRVRVKRESVSIRWRSVLNIPAKPPSTQQVITTALRSPLVERGLSSASRPTRVPPRTTRFGCWWRRRWRTPSRP